MKRTKQIAETQNVKATVDSCEAVVFPSRQAPTQLEDAIAFVWMQDISVPTLMTS